MTSSRVRQHFIEDLKVQIFSFKLSQLGKPYHCLFWVELARPMLHASNKWEKYSKIFSRLLPINFLNKLWFLLGLTKGKKVDKTAQMRRKNELIKGDKEKYRRYDNCLEGHQQ